MFQYCETYPPTSIRVGNSDIPFGTHARNLEITISSNTTMQKHVTNICITLHILTVNATKTLYSAFVLSKLDHCNSLLSGSRQYILDKLHQKVQNSAARLVMKSHKCDHVQPLLCNLYWLPVCPRIDYKISTLCFTTFSDSFPVYIAQLMSVYTPCRHLRSSRTHTFSVFLPPKLSHLIKEHSPLLAQLNGTQCIVKSDTESSPAFKTTLKTHLFRSA